MNELITGSALSGSFSFGLVPGIAWSAQRATYWISPYLTGTTYNYTPSNCVVFTQGWGPTAIDAHEHEHAGDRSGSIGVRAVDSGGPTTQITRDWNRENVVHLCRSQGVAKYKIYKSVGDL